MNERRSPAHQAAVIDLRRGNRAQPHKSKKLYSRTQNKKEKTCHEH